MASNADPARSAKAARGTRISRGPSSAARSLPTAGRRRTILYVIGLAALGTLPWDRRTQQHAIMLAIGLAAAAGLARESQARSLARLLAWDEKQYQRYLRTAEKNQV